jgi:glycosyltransferase involved in cell wall biosynthesis
MSTERPFISVVLTTHKRPGLLERAFGSLLKQDFQDFEIILCSDESSIETRQAAARHVRAHDTFICSPHLSGPAETRNIGIFLSRGSWICFLDDDDTFDENYFNGFYLANKNDKKVFYTNYNKLTEYRDGSKFSLISKESVIVQNFCPEYLYISNFIPINSVFIPREIAKSHKFDLNLETHEDWDYFVRLKVLGIEFEFCENLLGANIHLSDEKSRNRSESIPLDYLSIYRRWPAQSEVIKKARATILAQWGLNIPENFL